MNTISPQRITAAMSAAMQAISALPANEDTALIRDTIEGQSDVFEIIDALAEKAIADKMLAEKASERAKRITERADGNRKVIANMLEALGLTKIERALFTASMAQRQEIVEVATNEALPSVFVRSAPDKVLIGKTLRHGNPVPGYALRDKADLVLTLRSA